MKNLYVLFLLLCVTVKGMSQVVIDSKGTKVAVDSSKWTISGNNIFNKNSGNVGIGTSAPAAQLHTTGTVRFAGVGTNTVNTKVLTTDNSGNVTTRTFASLLSGSAITSLNGLTGSVQTFASGTTGTDFNVTSLGTVHTFNLPTASAANSGKLSASNWTTFNNKIGIVTSTTTAAVTTVGTTATINNTAAYWNANLLQGNAVSASTPASNQVLAWNGTNWAPANAAPAITTNVLSSAANTITSTVNGITSAPVNIINSNTLTQSGSNQLISTVNGVASSTLTANIAGDVTGNLGTSVVSKINGSPLGITTGASNGQVLSWNGSSWVPSNAAPAVTTNVISSAANIITSTVNGVTSNAPAVNSISNTINTNSLSTTVNGIVSTPVNIITSNSLSLNSGSLTSVVNGVSSGAVNVLATAGNGLSASGGIVEMGGTLTEPTTINTNTTNTLSLTGLQTGNTSDSLLVVASGGVIKRIVSPASFPQILVDARRTTAYTTGTSFATLIYNTTNINTGSAYNTTTGFFTAPATGLYEVILNNTYNWGAVNSQIVNQIVVNNVVDMEKFVSSYPTVTNTNSSVSGSTMVSMTGGQTIRILVGGLVGTATPLVGAGQHVMKIIRHQ